MRTIFVATTPRDRIRDLRKRIQSHGLTLSEFALFDSVVGDLASLSASAKAGALRNFEHGARIAHELGTDTLNMVAAWVRGLQGPTAYPPQVIYTHAEGQEIFSPKWELQCRTRPRVTRVRSLARRLPGPARER